MSSKDVIDLTEDSQEVGDFDVDPGQFSQASSEIDHMYGPNKHLIGDLDARDLGELLMFLAPTVCQRHAMVDQSKEGLLAALFLGTGAQPNHPIPSCS